MLLILAGGVILRTLMLLSPKSLWGDEFFSIELAARPFVQVVKDSIQDVHPPLYFSLLHFSMAVFGDVEWAYRLVSFLAGIGTLAAIYFIAKEWKGKGAAFYAAALAAASPYWLQCSNEIRGYSLLSFFSALAVLFFMRVCADPSDGRSRWAYAAAAVAAVYTEHYGWFVWGATLVAGFVRFRSDRPAMTRLLKAQALILAAGLFSFAVLVYQALFKEHVFHAYRMKEYLSLPIIAKKVAGILWHFANGYSFSMLTLDRLSHYLKSSGYFWVSAASCAAAASLMAAGFAKVFRQNKPLFALFFLVLCFPVLFLAVVYPIRLDARYLSFAAPLFFVIAGTALSEIGLRTVRSALFGLLIATALMGSARAIEMPTDPIHKEDYRGIVTYVFKEAGESDLICGLSPQVRYYREKTGLAARARVVPEIPDLDAAALAGVKRIWLLDIVNMHEDVTQRIFQEKRALIEPLGFRAVRGPVRFGGEESLLAYSVFERA